MLQQIAIGFIFLGAIAYLASMAYKSLTKKTCASGCGKCSDVDLEKVQKRLAEIR